MYFYMRFPILSGYRGIMHPRGRRSSPLAGSQLTTMKRGHDPLLALRCFTLLEVSTV